jgi:hypothetical protein
VHRHLLVSRVQIRIVAAGPGDAGLRVIGNDQPGHAAEELEGAHVGGEPVDQLLVGCGFGIRVGTGAEHRDEKMRLPDVAAGAAVNRDGGPGPVDEHLLASFVLLTQNNVLRLTPALVQLAESAVLVAFRVRDPIFFPEQLQRHVLVGLALLMEHGEVRCGALGFA